MTDDKRAEFPRLPDQVDVIDCTLRDGEQAPGVWFTPDEKVELAVRLAAAGLDVLDAGFPAGGSSDLEALQEMKRRELPARIGATARPVRGDIVAAEAARADEVFLFMPTSDLRLEQTLGITRAQASRMFRIGAEEVTSRGMRLNLVFEDATRADPELLARVVEDLRPHVPIERLIVCDTVGCSHPASMQRLVEGLCARFDPEIQLCPHCHDDFGMAVANTLAAVGGGARSITCTVNGLGERAGNASLAETVAALSHIYGVRHGVDPQSLLELSEAVERLSGMLAGPAKPVIGFNVFRHESGVHVDGMLKDTRSYEFLPSAWAGRETGYVLGKHSGTAQIRRLLHEAGLAFDEELVRRLLAFVKQTAETRSKAAHERMFAETRKFYAEALAGVDPEAVLEQARRRPAARS